ncbi:sugar-transfer associated ATP-grasp domain-containing protein [Gaetbulibacter aquiaggeris]|uniref:Sugar-transfer associated ATP-grasp domain-containing protein n=1 Tax=Gaetbulibacter aquiaggeris TaxID=1735373 RepID=A0ABW7MR15_9FLAO
MEQHPLLSQIHPNAINSLRMVHYIDKNNTVHIVSTFIRFGVGTSIIDNTSKGGFAVAVNNETGELQGVGRQEVSKGAATYFEHPNTHFKFKGFIIPYFQEALNLVKEFAFYFPNRIVGWDIAITPTGPLIIEGNHNPGLRGSDIAYGGYCKHPLIQEILEEIKK